MFGPIVALEMLTSSRRARYFIVRVAYAMVLLVILWINYSMVVGQFSSRNSAFDRRGTLSIREVAAFSQAFFGTFSFAQLVAVLLLTPAMIAGTIAQERERRTIEYLFASSLTDLEIIMSKFLARLLHVGSLLLVGLPLLSIAMMLGGIAPELLLMVFVVTLATLLATAALSIAVSVWARRSRDAVVRTYAFLLLFLLVPPVLWGMSTLSRTWTWLAWLGDAGQIVSQVNPLAVLSLVFTGAPIPAMGITPWQYVWPLAVTYGVFTCLMLAWSTASVRRIYRKSVGAGDVKSRRYFWQHLRGRFRPQIGNHPMLWKELFAATAAVNLGTLARLAVAILFAISIAPAIIIMHETTTRGANSVGQAGEALGYSSAGFVTVLQCAALLVVITRAAGSITAEKERDSWISLISTPLTPTEIVLAKIVGSIYAARWFLLPIGVWWGLTALFLPRFLVMVPVMVGLFLCLAAALGGLGLWFSSWCSTSVRAMSSAAAVVVFLGGGYLFCCMPVFIAGAGSGDGVEFILAPCIPYLLATPGVAWMQFQETAVSRPDDLRFVVVCIVGTAGYLLLGLLMASINISDFDALSGRPHASSVVPATAARRPTPKDRAGVDGRGPSTSSPPSPDAQRTDSV